jgi:hypothetical protein
VNGIRVAACRLLLRTYPHRIRAGYGSEMLETAGADEFQGAGRSTSSDGTV